METQITAIVEAHLLEQKNTIIITNEDVIEYFKINKQLSPTQILIDYINNPTICIKDNNVIIDCNKFITIQNEYTNYINEIDCFLTKCKIASENLNGNKNIELNNLFAQNNKENELSHFCEICNMRFKTFKGLSIHKRKCAKQEK